MRTRRSLGGGALLALSILLAAPAASAFCVSNKLIEWYKVNTPVYILWGHANGMEHVLGGDLLSYADVERGVRMAIQAWNTDGQGNKRFYLAGWTSYDFFNDSGVSNAVLIRAESEPCECCASGCAKYSGCSGSSPENCKRGLVLVSRASTMSDTWSLTPEDLKRDFVALIIHELGHLLGLHHPNTCGPQLFAVMAGFWPYTPEGHYLRKDDIEGMKSLWGWRTWSFAQNESTNGVGFSGSPAPTWMPDVRLGSISTDHSYNNGRMYIAYPFNRSAYAQNLTASGWSSRQIIRYGDEGTTYNPVSVATASSLSASTVIAVWLEDEQVNLPEKRIRYAISYNAGQLWSTSDILRYSSGRELRTYTNGVSVAFDPASNEWVIIYLTGDRILGSHTVNPSTRAQKQGFGALVGTRDVPSIACTRYTGQTYNCMMLEYTVPGCRITRRGKVDPTFGFLIYGGQTESYCYTSYLAGETPALTVRHYETYPWLRVKPSGVFGGIYNQITFSTSKHHWSTDVFGWDNASGGFLGGSFEDVSEAAAGHMNGKFYSLHLEKYIGD